MDPKWPNKNMTHMQATSMAVLLPPFLAVQWLSHRVFSRFLFLSAVLRSPSVSSFSLLLLLIFSERHIRARGGSSALRPSPCCPRHGVRLPHVLLSLDVFGNKIVLSIPTALLPPSHLPPKKLWREKGKKREILGPPPFRAPPFGAPTFGAPLFPGLGLHPSGPTFRGPSFSGFGLGPPPFGGPTLCGLKIQHPKICRSRNWPKSKLAEVEIGRSRIGRSRKKKLAEVGVGRSRSRSQRPPGETHQTV